MTKTESMVLEYLRAMRSDMTAMREDIREIKIRQTETARQLAALRQNQNHSLSRHTRR